MKKILFYIFFYPVIPLCKLKFLHFPWALSCPSLQPLSSQNKTFFCRTNGITVFFFIAFLRDLCVLCGEIYE